jgi:hypothetical protein
LLRDMQGDPVRVDVAVTLRCAHNVFPRRFEGMPSSTDTSQAVAVCLPLPTLDLVARDSGLTTQGGRSRRSGSGQDSCPVHRGGISVIAIQATTASLVVIHADATAVRSHESREARVQVLAEGGLPRIIATHNTSVPSRTHASGRVWRRHFDVPPRQAARATTCLCRLQA